MLFASLIAISLCADERFSAFKQGEMQEYQQRQQKFEQFQQDTAKAFKAYQQEIRQAYQDYKKELSVYWEEPKLPTKKEWVGYSSDKKTRTSVDFEENVITVETISADEQTADQQLKKALAAIITEDVETVKNSDPLIRKIEQINKKQHAVAPPPPSQEPLLAPVIFEKAPTKKVVNAYVDKLIKPANIRTDPSRIKDAKRYSIEVRLPANSMQKRSRLYVQDVRKNAGRFDLPVPLIFAVMHTESSFNPLARSHVPAYGLMQIVPWSAGVDTYQFLYNIKKQPSSTYLYDSQNNIEMGSAYLHMLYYRYLTPIADPLSRLYCTIAAYNTGAGNVAYAWTGDYNVGKAARRINQMSPGEVYEHLLKHLRYDEPRHYLRRVNARMDQYHKLYGDI